MSEADTTRAVGVVVADRRYHGLDALRAGAMALGVVLHAAAPYLQQSMPGLQWAVEGPAAGSASVAWLDGLYWWLHAWRVPLFFVLAGFFAMLLATRRGVAPFLDHRNRRVLLPLLVSCAVILPVSYFAFGWGWVRSGWATWDEVLRLSLGEELRRDDVVGPAHLWFLEYLYLFSVLFAAGMWLLRRCGRPPGQWWRNEGPPPTGRWIAWLGGVWVVSAGLVAVEPEIAYSFENSFVPRGVEFVYHGWFFGIGAVLYLRRGVLDPLARAALPLVAVAILVGSLAAWWTLPRVEAWHGQGSVAAGRAGTFSNVAYAAAWAAAAWLTIAALLAAAVRWLARPRAAIRWLSDSAYWVYLAHVPIVAAIHVALLDSGLPASVRFLLAIAGGVAATLVTYRYAVRYSWLGVGLHGPRGKES
ncbi:MAG: acyltransferase family protein [Phycisphaeraceae bacterium]